MKSTDYDESNCVDLVAPLVGAWIEIWRQVLHELVVAVAPLVGAWIEMLNDALATLKTPVAPLVGAWIEISGISNSRVSSLVAPLVGAWIEIAHHRSFWHQRQRSLPSWERGLKYSAQVR